MVKQYGAILAAMTIAVALAGAAGLGARHDPPPPWEYDPRELDGVTGNTCTFALGGTPDLHGDLVCREIPASDGLIRQTIRRLHIPSEASTCGGGAADVELVRACVSDADGNPVQGALTPCGSTGPRGCAVCVPGLLFTCHSFSLAQLTDRLRDIAAANPGTPLADKIAGVVAKAEAASAELWQMPPARIAAAGNIEGAVGDLESAVSSRLLFPGRGATLMDDFAALARQLADAAIEEATSRGGKAADINEARLRVAEGDALRTRGRFKNAVNSYRNAINKAQGA